MGGIFLKGFNKKIILLMLVIGVLFTLAGCGDKKEEVIEPEIQVEEEKNEESGGEIMTLNQLEMPIVGEEIAIFKTNHGDIKVRLFPQVAPKAVENLVTHAKNGYYDGVIFHRIIKDFMIQGGDPDSTGRGGESIWGAPFEDEFDIMYRNFRGALSMANAGPGTNGSQFFIVHASQVGGDIIEQMKTAGEEKGYPEAVVEAYEELGGTYWLDFNHTVFGQVFEGMDIVDEIANLKTDNGDKPLEPVIIETIEIVEYK